MFFAILIAGGAGTAVSGYLMYQGGQALAQLTNTNSAQLPSKTFMGLMTGGVSAIGAYALQNQCLNLPRFNKYLTVTVPQNVEKWTYRDFARATGPFVVSRMWMFSASLAVMGFITVKVDALQQGDEEDESPKRRQRRRRRLTE